MPAEVVSARLWEAVDTLSNLRGGETHIIKMAAVRSVMCVSAQTETVWAANIVPCRGTLAPTQVKGDLLRRILQGEPEPEVKLARAGNKLRLNGGGIPILSELMGKNHLHKTPRFEQLGKWDNAQELLGALSYVYPVMAPSPNWDGDRASIEGVLLEPEYLMALDGHRAHFVPMTGPGMSVRFTPPAVRVLSRILGPGVRADLYRDEGRVLLQAGNWEVGSLQPPYAPYQQLIRPRADYRVSFDFDVGDLHRVVEGLPGESILLTVSRDVRVGGGDRFEWLRTKTSGKGEVVLSRQYLLDALPLYEDSGRATMYLGEDALQPVSLYVAGDLRAIIMPRRNP